MWICWDDFTVIWFISSMDAMKNTELRPNPFRNITLIWFLPIVDVNMLGWLYNDMAYLQYGCYEEHQVQAKPCHKHYTDMSSLHFRYEYVKVNLQWDGLSPICELRSNCTLYWNGFSPLGMKKNIFILYWKLSITYFYIVWMRDCFDQSALKYHTSNTVRSFSSTDAKRNSHNTFLRNLFIGHFTSVWFFSITDTKTMVWTSLFWKRRIPQLT